MAFVAGLSALSGVLGTVGAVASGVGAISSGMYSAQVARNNATIASQNAQYAREAGQEQAAVESMKGAAQLGKIKAGQAASGIDVNSGSAVDVQAGQRAENQLDTETVLNNAELSAYGYTTQQQNFETQADQDETGGILTGLGTALSHASGVSWPGG
jgi:hypothetical protein